MLQLRLLLHRTTTRTTPTCTRGPVPPLTPSLTPICTLIVIISCLPIPTTTGILTPTTTPTPTRRNTLTSAPLPRAPTRLCLGIPLHLSLLAGSCRQLRRHKEPTSIKGLSHAAQSWKYQFKGMFSTSIGLCRINFCSYLLHFSVIHQ